jgi:hypothetical protein
MSTSTSRNWDGSPESEHDERFHNLRDSGYTGPIDEDGYAATDGPDAATLKGIADQRGEDTSWWTGLDDGPRSRKSVLPIALVLVVVVMAVITVISKMSPVLA